MSPICVPILVPSSWFKHNRVVLKRFKFSIEWFFTFCRLYVPYIHIYKNIFSFFSYSFIYILYVFMFGLNRSNQYQISWNLKLIFDLSNIYVHICRSFIYRNSFKLFLCTQKCIQSSSFILTLSCCFTQFWFFVHLMLILSCSYLHFEIKIYHLTFFCDEHTSSKCTENNSLFFFLFFI